MRSPFCCSDLSNTALSAHPFLCSGVCLHRRTCGCVPVSAGICRFCSWVRACVDAAHICSLETSYVSHVVCTRTPAVGMIHKHTIGLAHTRSAYSIIVTTLARRVFLMRISDHIYLDESYHRCYACSTCLSVARAAPQRPPLWIYDFSGQRRVPPSWRASRASPTSAVAVVVLRLDDTSSCSEMNCAWGKVMKCNEMGWAWEKASRTWENER